MSDQAANRKPDGSAWKAHMEELAARNDATRKAGREARQERERLAAVQQRATERHQSAELRRLSEERGGSASLKRSTKG